MRRYRAATLYSLLTARVPIPAKYQKYVPLQPPKKFNPKISDRVNDAILQGMALVPQDRPQTVGEWLELVIDGTPSPVPQSQQEEGNSIVNIPTQKFEFEYAALTVISLGFLGMGKSYKITRYLGQAELFTEDLGNGISLEMVAIPGGSFMMGSPENEPERGDNESPQHLVTIPPFFIGKFAITQEQYQAH